MSVRLVVTPSLVLLVAGAALAENPQPASSLVTQREQALGTLDRPGRTVPAGAVPGTAEQVPARAGEETAAKEARLRELEREAAALRAELGLSASSRRQYAIALQVLTGSAEVIANLKTIAWVDSRPHGECIERGSAPAHKLHREVQRALGAQRLKRIAAPTLTAEQGGGLSILYSGGELPIVIPNRLGEPFVEFQQYGLRIAAAPQAGPNGRDGLRLSIEDSVLDHRNSVTVEGVRVPGLTTRNYRLVQDMTRGEAFVFCASRQHHAIAEGGDEAIPDHLLLIAEMSPVESVASKLVP